MIKQPILIVNKKANIFVLTPGSTPNENWLAVCHLEGRLLMNRTQITALEHWCRCTVTCSLLPTKPQPSKLQGLITVNENIHLMTNIWVTRHPITLGVMKATGIAAGPRPTSDVQPGKIQRNTEATWENKDKVALQKGTVGPKLSQRHGAQSLSLFSTPETQDGERVTKSASILMGEVLT